MSNVLELKELRRSFTQGDVTLDVLDGASAHVSAGEVVGLVGPSGSGKSTLLQIAGLLEPPDSGQVLIEGKPVKDRADAARTALRRTKIGFVYQFHNLLPDFTALENLVLPQLIADRPRKDAEDNAKVLLDRVGLSQRIEHFPSELSGGEQQRVAIARALVNGPMLLLADEPTGNLDPHTSDRVFGMLLETVRAVGLGALIATHNIELTHKMDRVLEMRDGKLAQL